MAVVVFLVAVYSAPVPLLFGAACAENILKEKVVENTDHTVNKGMDQ